MLDLQQDKVVPFLGHTVDVLTVIYRLVWFCSHMLVDCNLVSYSVNQNVNYDITAEAMIVCRGYSAIDI